MKRVKIGNEAGGGESCSRNPHEVVSRAVPAIFTFVKNEYLTNTDLAFTEIAFSLLRNVSCGESDYVPRIF